jgi:hypothetical protein
LTSSYFQKWNWSWKDAGLIPLKRSWPNSQDGLTLWQKRNSRKCSNNGGDDGTGVYMRKGTTSRVMVADRPYGEFHDFYSVSPEYFGYTFIWYSITLWFMQNLWSGPMQSRTTTKHPKMGSSFEEFLNDVGNTVQFL